MTRLSATLSLVSCVASIAAAAALAPSTSALGNKHVLSQTIKTAEGMKQETGEESVRLEAEFQRMIVDADAEEPFELQKIDIEVYVGISLEKRQYGFNCEIDLSESGYEELKNCQSLDGDNSATLAMSSGNPLPEVRGAETGSGYSLSGPLPLALNFELSKYQFNTGVLYFAIGPDQFVQDTSSTETIRFKYQPSDQV